MKELEELLEPIEAEHVVIHAVGWIGMRYFGMFQDLTFQGQNIATYIDEVAIIVTVLISANLIFAFLQRTWEYYKELKNQEPEVSWETYEPQTTDMRNAHREETTKILQQWESEDKSIVAREVKMDEGTEVEILEK